MNALSFALAVAAITAMLAMSLLAKSAKGGHSRLGVIDRRRTPMLLAALVLVVAGGLAVILDGFADHHPNSNAVDPATKLSGLSPVDPIAR